jgi:hypothetical protein
MDVLNKPQSIEDNLLAQIAYHKQMIKDLEFNLELIKKQPKQTAILPINAPLTRDLVRAFLANINGQVQTVFLIDSIYKEQTEEMRSKLIKTLSVIFNQMEKDGEIAKERKKGVKGNFYMLVKK